MDKEIINTIKHIETFYEQAPPGYVKEEEEKPEDCIPDTEGNRAARDFLANAPTKGLWMPLGKEVKVMQCWRCKQFGHRTGDRECPLFKSGNTAIEKFRAAYEDPMYHFVESSKKEENAQKMNWLQHLVNLTTTSESSGSEDGTKAKKKKKSKNKKHRKDDKHSKKSERQKKKKHKRKHETSDSDSDRDDKPSSSRKRKMSLGEKKRSHSETKHDSAKKKHKHKSKH